MGELLADVVTGRDAFDVAGTAEAMARQVRNVGRPGVAAMAISAVDIALWDLKARLLGVALSSLLGRARDTVPVYGSGGFTSYSGEQTREQLSGWVEKQRIPRVKIKIGESWGSEERRDLARVRLAREVIGPDAELYVDANGGYTTGQAVRVAAALDDYGVTWFEEPVSSRDPAGLAAIRRQVRPDVAAGEYSWSLADSAALIAAGAVDCLQLDVTRCGGITEFGRGAALAAANQPPGLRALRAEPARARRGGGAEPAAPGVLPRPPADRAAAVRRRPRPGRRRPAPGSRPAGTRDDPARGRRGAVPACVTITTIRRTADDSVALRPEYREPDRPRHRPDAAERGNRAVRAEPRPSRRRGRW